MNHIRISLFFLFGFIASMPAVADWAALAVADDGAWGTSVQESSKKRAESQAIKNCNKHKATGTKCKVVGSFDQLGYAVVAQSTSRVEFNIADSLEDAKRNALDNCSKHTSTGDLCKIKWTGINGVLRNQPQATNAHDCRPRTPEVRCRSNCVNGNCVVEYENGCKIRVQVSPRFDSLSNQWTYPSPSC